MLQETEIKLSLSTKTMALLMTHPEITQRLKGHWQTVTLYNQYYDTQSLALDQANVALRLRRDGDQVIQTFKERGSSVAGLSVRNEWDWYLDDYRLSLESLGKNCWPDTLEGLDKTTIIPVFTTNFTRTKAMLHWCWQSQDVAVEVALDEGLAQTDDAHDVICELELEIREGPVDALMELAVALAADLPLFPSSISKAERGYQLLNPELNKEQRSPRIVDKNHNLDGPITVSGDTLLGCAQQLIESMILSPQTKTLEKVLEQLIWLRCFFSDRKGRLSVSDQQSFYSLLGVMISDIQTLLQLNLAVSQLSIEFKKRLATPTWGVLFLKVSKWCLLKEWLPTSEPA